jgi:hypothetical protein
MAPLFFGAVFIATRFCDEAGRIEIAAADAPY